MELIDKATIVTEIERRIALLENNSDGIISMLASGMLVNEYKDLLSFLETLKVKEVDLEKEINLWIEDNTCGGYCSANIRETAEYFFELGLKTKKGE